MLSASHLFPNQLLACIIMVHMRFSMIFEGKFLLLSRLLNKHNFLAQHTHI